MALSVVTFNIGGGERTRDEKKRRIDDLLSEHLPSLLCIQENPWPYKDCINDHVSMIKEKYNAVHVYQKHGDAAVFYRKDVLEDKGSEELIKLFLEPFEGKQHLNFAKFKERASFSKLTEIKTETSFIAISWHGEHKIKDPQKKDKFKDLLSVMAQIHWQTYFPVILGGDFNIALDTVSDIIEEQGLGVYDYEPVNRETVIDFFVTTPDTRVSETSAFSGYMYVNDGQQQQQQRQVFDHDPVQANVSFHIEDEWENLTYSFRRLGL